MNYHKMDISLIGFDSFDNDEATKSFLSNIYAVPQLDYERHGWLLSMKTPVKWLHQSVNGIHDHINLLPRFSARKRLTAKSEISASLSYKLYSPQAYMYVLAPVLSDYRNLFIANDIDKYSQNVAATASYRYRNPLSSFFVNASLTYNYSRSSIMSNQLFIDDFIVTTFADKLSFSNSWYLTGGISKGLGHSRMVVGCDVTGSMNSASSMRDNVAEEYNQLILSAKPYFKGSICRWFSVNFDANYSFFRLKIGEIDNNTHSFNQKLYATLMPQDRWDFTFGAEHFLTRFSEGNLKNLILLDASAVWRVSNKVRLSITANNLLNQRQYQYVTYGTLSRTEHSFRIRPCNVLVSIQWRF
ncbi:MAG: hypothetical protein K2K23_08370 [Muribaculaceae bacterium]|nr:hypothetical protein [Muribaculaceae bacterium]